MSRNTPFGDRLLAAFKGLSKKDVAGKLGVRASRMTELTTKEDLHLSLDLLARISEIPNYDLKYLFSGKGDPGGGELDFLSEAQQTAVARLAAMQDGDEGRVLRELIMEGLRCRARYLLSLPQREVGAHEHQEIEVLVELLRHGGSDDAGDGLAPEKKTANNRR